MTDPYGNRPIGEAFNDPRVPCCGRDAADCDCSSELTEYVENPDDYRGPDRVLGNDFDMIDKGW